MSFAVKLLNCIECKKNFTYSVEEQKFHSARGFPNDPWRCLPCRQARKPQSTQEANRADSKLPSASFFR